MTSRLTTRSDTPTVSAKDRTSDRILATQTACRTKAAKQARSDHKAARTQPRAPSSDTGVTMMYQQGFTSGPSM
ncbi:hypothetical protein [Gymnodinialimonas hymeniacidonis]|uniref:hypothetical protein n=1 Tax=Gymnodinialimonas hymeniacidonis TaxID=3126508 RepID=UPI0034C64C05